MNLYKRIKKSVSREMDEAYQGWGKLKWLKLNHVQNVKKEKDLFGIGVI